MPMARRTVHHQAECVSQVPCIMIIAFEAPVDAVPVEMPTKKSTPFCPTRNPVPLVLGIGSMNGDSEELLRLFIDQAPVPIAMFDREMRYIAASRRWVNDYGFGKKKWRGVSHYELFPDIPDRWREIHQRALNGEVVAASEDRFDRADGT